jgi:hypothetical protein
MSKECLIDACKLLLLPVPGSHSQFFETFQGLDTIVSAKKMFPLLSTIIGIMFTLEALDTWKDFTAVINRKVEEPGYPEEDYDPYDVVPVPNTSYRGESKLEGSCMISTVRNLLFIFCRHKVGINSYILNFSGLNSLVSDFLRKTYGASKNHLSLNHG